MTEASPTPPATPATPAETPRAKAPSRNIGIGILGLALAFMTPLLVMYAASDASGSGLAGVLAYVLTAGLMALFLIPKSPLGIKNKTLGLIVRIVLYAGVVALLIATGLPVWAVIYAILATLVLVLGRAKRVPAAE